MSQRWIHPIHTRVKSSKAFDNVVLGPLSDKKIAEYERAGWYSADAKRARLDRAEKKFKQQKRDPREGNFVLSEDGRLIYSPR